LEEEKPSLSIDLEVLRIFLVFNVGVSEDAFKLRDLMKKFMKLWKIDEDEHWILVLG